MIAVGQTSLGDMSGYLLCDQILRVTFNGQVRNYLFSCQVSRFFCNFGIKRYIVTLAYIFLLCLGLHYGCEQNPTSVVCQAVDVQDECVGQLNADFDFTSSVLVAGYHLLPSGTSLINSLVLSFFTDFFLVSTFFTAFCLSVCFKIFKFFIYF